MSCFKVSESLAVWHFVAFLGNFTKKAVVRFFCQWLFKIFMEEVREIVCLDCSYTMKAFFQNLENRIITRYIPGWRAAPLEKANKSWVAPTGRDDPAGHNDTSALDASQHRAARHQHAGRENHSMAC